MSRKFYCFANMPAHPQIWQPNIFPEYLQIQNLTQWPISFLVLHYKMIGSPYLGGNLKG